MSENSTVSKIEKLTDEELVRLSLGNKKIFYYLIKRYERKLLRYINRISDITQPESEDILQDIFIKVYCNLNGFNQKLKFSSWIYRIAHNEIINFYQKNKSRLQKSHLQLNHSDINNLSHIINDESYPYQALISREKADKIKELLEKLPHKYREVLVLRYLEGKKYTEISDILRKPPGTVAILINRAKSKFKNLTKYYWLKGEK
jgi:RNA polymerase sigma-70 factor (ECF subfamily)